MHELQMLDLNGYYFLEILIFDDNDNLSDNAF